MGLLDELLMGQTKKRNLMMQGTSPRVGGQLTQMVARPSQVPLREQFPTVYGALGGLLGMEPDSMEGSILDPNTAAVRQGAGYGYPAGLALQALPMAAPASRGAMVVGRAGERYAEKVVPQIMERGGLGAEMLGAMSNRTISPLDVYHGTPYTLPPTARNPLGEFDASKIGTGEGAQVYGHGIYTAEAPAVAQGYKDTLAYKAFDVAPEAEKLGLKLNAGARGEFIRQAAVNKSAEAKARSLQNANIAARDLPKEKLAELFKAYEDRGGGNLYKVDLPDEMIPKMLDYDKHLSEQSPEVQKILLPYQKEIGSSFGTGDQTLKAIAFERRMKGLDDSPAAVAEQLRQMGIPGVKYLDQQSRNAGGWHLTSPDNTVRGKWMLKSSDYNSNGVFFDSKKEAEAALKEKLGKETRNFVTFPGEEKNLRILERNGLLY